VTASPNMVPRRALIETLVLFNGLANVIGSGKPILHEAVSDACGPLVEVAASNDFKTILNGARDHDNYSHAHSIRVATYLALFGFDLRLPKDEQILLDVGWPKAGLCPDPQKGRRPL
jgi:hypothetical protein